MMMNGGLAPMPPRLTNRGIEVNPSPHEIAIGSLEQWRRSKMTMVWKSVLVSLVKGHQGEGMLCVWRDAIGGMSRMELLQRVPFRDIQHVHSDHGGILRVSLYYSSEEPLTFRCLQEPQAIQQWVATLRSVTKNGHQGGYGGGQATNYRPAAVPAPAAAPKPVVSAPAAPAVDLLSHDVAAGGATPDFLMGNNPQPTVRPVQYQSYPPANGTAFPAQPSPQARSPQAANMFSPHQANNFGQPYPMQQPTQQAYPQQQPTYQPQFSQPPPLPTHRSIAQSANYKTKPGAAAFTPQPPMPPMQPTNNMYQQQQQRARSVSPMPMGGGMGGLAGFQRGKSPVRAQQLPKAKSPTNVTKDHYKAQPLQPAYKSIPKPPPAPAPAPRAVPRPHAKKTPRRSLSAPMSPQRPKTVNKGPGPVSPEELKKHIMVSWALIPPRCIKLKSMIDLCRSIQLTFPPHNKMIQPHVYFDTWMPIMPGEYNQPNGIHKVIKKCRFFLHPDKLPRDFTPDQILLCKLLWDILSDAKQHQLRD